jgi:hypothetical protein
MPEKARRGRPHSKKGKAIQRAVARPAERTETPVQEPARNVTAPVDKHRAAAPSQKVRYSYVTAELKRIGIFTGGIVAVLIILALALS